MPLMAKKALWIIGIISLIAMFVSISVASLVEDVHYGFGNLESDRIVIL